jgi:hypothetical protein
LVQAAALLLVLVSACGRARPAAKPQGSPPEYAPGLQGLLDGKLALLHQLARDPTIQEAVERANSARPLPAAEEIARRDARWRHEEADDGFALGLQSNAAAQCLTEFCAGHSGFPEVFVTDRQGLVVAMSNRTSDYLQADEDWWQRTYAEGRGRAGGGWIEYDASARRQAIPLYVPVPAATGSRVAGVIKALFDMDTIKAEL